jgi:diguanylate cyclase (GGDEF)-like protein
MNAARASRVALRIPRATLAVGALLLAAFVLRALGAFGDAATQRLFATWISDAIVLSAVAVCLWRALVERSGRMVWALAGLGMASWGLGNAYFEHTLAAGARLPNPSPADIGYLGFYPLMYLAVIAVRRHPLERLSVGVWLDGAVGAVACATLAAAFVLEPVIGASSGESLAGALTDIAYPIGDLVLLTMLVVTTATVGWRRVGGLAWLAAGLAFFAISDTLYIVENANGSYHVGDVLDAGWLLALTLMAYGAATLQSGKRHRARRAAIAPEHAVTPILAGLVALVVLGLQPLLALDAAARALAIATLALVLVRLALSLRETAQLLAQQARAATRDPLTGLRNRRALLVDLARRIEEASAEHPELLVLFDLDGFKVYNDTFGHGAGDTMLIEVANGLGESLGARGHVYRMGGDEFCALLTPGARPPEQLGEELAAAMSRRGEDFSISASYGCALAPADGEDTTTLLRRADERMYERKGRRHTRLEAQLRHQADHDMLTGLRNRQRFADELERVLRYSSRYRRAGALLVLDLDNLKFVNDMYGHAAGDAALKIVAREIRARTRSTDLSARLGGDEFAVLLHEADERAALLVAAELREHLRASEIDPPVQLSVGVALFGGTQELVADDLLTAADIALYEAKEGGRDETRVYRGDSEGALGWVQRIRSALVQERFVLYAQPIVDLHSGRTSHRELLLRMLSDDADVIPPDAFIPTAERFGLINQIDRWVTREGLALALRGERPSINLSAHSIGDRQILQEVRAAADAGLREGAVIFEITETAAMTNMNDARAFAEELGRLGCDVALDDFGTGFGSFSHLKHLPTRYLKIDVEFVRDVAFNTTDQEVVKSITAIGHSLEKLIIAEGVENRVTASALRRYGVDYAQGFQIGAPQRISPPTPLERALRAGARDALPVRAGQHPA